MENRLRLFSDLFNNGAAGSCWPASPGSLAGADSHYIINCLPLAVQRGFWRGAWCFGKQPLPPASRALFINVSLPLKTPPRGMVSTWLWSQALLQPQGREFSQCPSSAVAPWHLPCAGHRLPQPPEKGTGQSQGCRLVMCGGN